MVDALVRYRLLVDPDRFPRGRVQPYGGIGLGPVLAHAENRIDNVKNDEGYELGGVGFQIFLGARVLLARHFGVFVEYKFTHSRLSVSVAGGDADVTEGSHHLVGGITVPFTGF